MSEVSLRERLARLPSWWYVLAFSLYYFTFFCKKTILTASDLGRHIMNGRVIVETGHIFSTNLYSYTNPERFTPNHHWLFGVITHYIHDIFGFTGLTVFSALLYTSAVSMILLYIAQKYGKKAMLLAGFIVLPLITMRAEVRPEAFSLFFFSAQLLALQLWYEKKVTSLLTSLVLIVTGILWVNVHIFFFMEFLIIGSFGVQALITKDWKKLPMLIIFGILLLLTTLINPLGLTGALYPTKILTEYGYAVAENQSPFFFIKYYPLIYYFYVVGVFGVILGASFSIIKKNWRSFIAPLLICLVLLAATAKMTRFSNFLAVSSLLVLAPFFQNLVAWFSKRIGKIMKNTVYLSLVSFVGCAVLIAIVSSKLFLPVQGLPGFGLATGIQRSGEFYKTLDVHGPVFNNFDIGSYLIYHLYPKEKVYVDNRAEAYPAQFLQEYQAAQTDDALWKKLDDQYHFGAIYFYRLENTNWGQSFLVKTVRNSDWVPIFVDDYTIIFIRNIPEHKELIEKYKLPPELFARN